MDLLQECANAFQKLLVYEYHFVVGRKGQRKEFKLSFQESDFHHLAGLHKLKDIAQIQQGMREKIYQKIIMGKITLKQLEKSIYFEQMNERILPLSGLESMLDDNNMIFRYNEKIQKFSLIRADYLLEGKAQELPVFLFLGKRKDNEWEQMCRTFFKKGDKDYTEGQPMYTLLKKEKIHIPSGHSEMQYNRIGGM